MIMRTIVALASLAFLAVVIATLVDQGFADAGPLLDSTWGRIALADLYLGFGLFACVIGIVERSWLQGLLWGVALCLVGNPVAGLWLLIRGSRLLGPASTGREIAQG